MLWLTVVAISATCWLSDCCTELGSRQNIENLLLKRLLKMRSDDAD